jgi:phospholipid/cholesterol/gamma-HCH transport system substrate-binding protein
MRIRTEVKIGIIAVIALAVTYWGLNFLKGRNVLRAFNEYVVFYNNIGGLEINSKVYMSGFWVGQVNDIYFTPGRQDELTVILGIRTEYLLPRYSVAELYSADIMGTKAIRIRLSGSEEYHEPGDTLISTEKPGLTDMLDTKIDPLKDKTEKILGSIDSLLLSWNYIFDEATRSDLKESINKLTNTSREIDALLQENGKLRRIINDIESITSNIKEHNEQIALALTNIADVSDSLAQSELKSAIYQANKTLEYSHSILKKIDEGEGTIGMLVNNDSLYNNLESSSAELDRILKDLQDHPAKYIHFSVFGGKKTK